MTQDIYKGLRSMMENNNQEYRCTPEEIQQILEQEHFDPNQTQVVLRGLQLLEKYDSDVETAFEHDIIFASSFHKTSIQMSKDELILMRHLGWFEYEESWAHY